MDSDQGKLFIGGISWETTEEKLKDYFQAFGKVAEAVIMKDRATGRARGFGFVVFTDPSIADMVVLEKHSIDGRMVEAKKAVPRDEQQSVNRSNNGGGGGLTPSNPTRTKKIFVGGLASTVTENDFRKYFGQFGIITDVVVMYDHGTQRPRGFGFITYDSEDAVDRVLQKTFHDLNEKMVEVKRAVPKDLSAGPIRNNGVGLGVGAGRGGPYGGGYAQALNSSPITSYGMRMDSRYGPSLASRGSYPPYGAIGYGNTGHYSGSFNGAYSAGMHGGGGLYGGGGYGGSSSGSGGYGSIGSRFSSSNASTAYGSSPGRSVWGGGGASYGNVSSSEGFGGTGGPSLSSYGGVGTWGSSQAPSNSSAAYGSHSYGYGGGDGAYISSNSPGYAGQSSRYGSSPGGLGGSRLGSGSSALFGGIYGSSGYGGSTWRATPADTFNSVSAGSGGLRSGVYGLSSGTNDNGEDIQTGEEGYGVTGRQSYRGVPV